MFLPIDMLLIGKMIKADKDEFIIERGYNADKNMT